MDRRLFLKSGTATVAFAALPRISFAQQLPFEPRPGAWRTYEIITRVEVLRPAGATRAWVPVPSVEGDYQKIVSNTWSGNGGAQLARDGKYGAGMVAAEWSATEKAPVLEVVSTFSTRNRAEMLPPQRSTMERPTLRQKIHSGTARSSKLGLTRGYVTANTGDAENFDREIL